MLQQVSHQLDGWVPIKQIRTSVSVLAWLDTSPEEQRRVRELVGLFTRKESLDELGIGQIRDVLGDVLYPGTSTIQTRARYFLFVPWIFDAVERRGHAGPDLTRRAELDERRLVEALRSSGDEGVIGRMAGPSVKTLPSAIYWSGLQRWGILLASGSRSDLGGARASSRDGADELAERVAGTWHPGLPRPPDGFPKEVSGLSLTREEADWLVERVLDRCSGSLLAHLVTSPRAVDLSVGLPWNEPAAQLAPAEVTDMLSQAELFSLTVQGPRLLYNLLLAEAYHRAGLTRIEPPIPEYRELLDQWVDEVRAHHSRLLLWDLERFWDVVTTQNPRVTPRTRAFVQKLFEVVRSDQFEGIARSPELRGLVADRERETKGKQARLANERLLGGWAGASGAGRLDFRWGTVRRIVADMLEGRGMAVAGS